MDTRAARLVRVLGKMDTWYIAKCGCSKRRTHDISLSVDARKDKHVGFADGGCWKRHIQGLSFSEGVRKKSIV